MTKVITRGFFTQGNQFNIKFVKWGESNEDTFDCYVCLKQGYLPYLPVYKSTLIFKLVTGQALKQTKISLSIVCELVSTAPF